MFFHFLEHIFAVDRNWYCTGWFPICILQFMATKPNLAAINPPWKDFFLALDLYFVIYSYVPFFYAFTKISQSGFAATHFTFLLFVLLSRQHGLHAPTPKNHFSLLSLISTLAIIILTLLPAI